MDSEKVIKRDSEYVLHTYNRNPIVLEKGHGLYAEGPEGQKYLDLTSGIGVNSLGYCDVDWAEAVAEQAHKLQHTSNLYYTAPCGKLAKKLCKRTGMSKVFFGNSGAEANEGAIKAARKYSFDHYGKGRDTVITLVNSFHGRTIATLTATGQEVFHNYFGPFNEGLPLRPGGRLGGADRAGGPPYLRGDAGAGAGRGAALWRWTRSMFRRSGSSAMKRTSSSSWMKSRPALAAPAPSCAASTTTSSPMW